MDQDDFNRDMGDYLRKQDGGESIFSRLKKKKWVRHLTSPLGDVPTFSGVQKGGDVATVSSIAASDRFAPSLMGGAKNRGGRTQ